MKGELPWEQTLTLCQNWREGEPLDAVNVWVFPLGGLYGEVTVIGGCKQDQVWRVEEMPHSPCGR